MSIHFFRFSVQLIYIAKRNKKIKQIRKMEKNGEQRKTHRPKMSLLPGYRERMKLSRETTQLYVVMISVNCVTVNTKINNPQKVVTN